MKKVLITGGSGFIGTNLIEHYKSIGDEVFNIDIKQPRNIEHFDQWYKVDILDKDKLTSTIKEIMPNIVFHMAARTDLNGLDVGNYDVNTKGVENLINVLNEINTLEFVVFASSMLVCRLGYKPSSEVDYCPNTPYGKSKVIGEELIRSSNISFPWVIVRPTSIWGPWFATPYRNFFDMIRKGFYVHPEGVRVRRSYGFVYNSVFQLSKISDRLNNELVSKTIYLADYQPIELKTWSKNIQMNLEARPVKEVPMYVFKAIAKLGDILKFFGYKNPPMSTFRLNNMLTPMVHDTKPLKDYCEDIPYSIDEGVEITCEWLKTHKR
jgi:nucleoside-diphosphate-sugar epimerase